jgi:transcriptional regulator with XRE-family HTH domain
LEGSYAQCKLAASPDLHGGAFFTQQPCGILPGMARKRTYIRAWRENRGYTLDDMIGRLEALGTKITGASLSRIERGIQPYSQDIIEAIAEALNLAVADLIENDPTVPEAEIIDLVRHLDERQKRQAESVLKAMFGERA